MLGTKKAREYGESVVLIERSENFDRGLMREFLAELQSRRADGAPSESSSTPPHDRSKDVP